MTKPFNIIQHFLKSAQKYPENIAINEGQQSISYKTLAKEVKQMANYYRAQGISEGDRILVFIPMSIDLYRSVLALFYLGATAVFLDEWVEKKRMAYCCELSHCKAFIAPWKVCLLACLSKPLRQIPKWLKPGNYKNHNADIKMTATSGDVAALITFTTGSTGKPKAAKRSHNFLNAQFKALCHKIKPRAEDVAMPVLPIVLLCNLGVGATSVIASYPSRKPEKFRPKLAVQQIQDLGVHRISSSPYFVKKLAEYCLVHKIQLQSLQQIFTGGAPVFPEEARLYAKAFPETDIEIVYGSTEAEPIASVKVQDLLMTKNNTEGLLVGNIYEHTALKVISISENPLTPTTATLLDEMVLSNGAIGEIIVAGDHVLKEYFRAPEAWRANKILAGDTLWHRTGDSGYVDDQGRLFLTGRCKQLIKKPEGGYWAPFVFEGLLQQISEINLATLLADGEKIIVIAEAKHKANLQLLKKRMSDLLPESIQDIFFVDRMPRDQRHHSKIDYEKIRHLGIGN